MDEYMDMDHRCFTCDSRHCWNNGCTTPGNVYVPGYGWASPLLAATLEAGGYYKPRWEEVVPA